jgi:G3E family GTPase
MSPEVPFTILTGWLGAGKTTTLNRVLSAPHRRRIAVLINELGRIAIDTRLILSRGSDVLELAGGCVCCKVDIKNDLWDGIADIISRSAPDHVVLETTGIAEPGAILEGLSRVPEELRRRILPAGIVCVVDAESAEVNLRRREEASEQVRCADRLLLTKLDRAGEAAARATHKLLADLAPAADRASFASDDAGAMALTSWLLARGQTPQASAHPHAHRSGQLTVVAFSCDEPLLGERVVAIAKDLGDRLLRAKGFVHLVDEPRRGFLEKAGPHVELTLRAPWSQETPRTELVFIGEDLDEAAVQRALHASRAQHRSK